MNRCLVHFYAMQTTIDLHVFASAKGGVGKSTLAVACAKLLAATPGCLPIVVDADMTGTSLADGLRGLPPPFLNDALRPFLESKTDELVNVRVDSLLWHHEEDDDVWYLPSS